MAADDTGGPQEKEARELGESRAKGAATPAAPDRSLVPLEQLVDLEALREGLPEGRPIPPQRLRDALPAGWVLAEDQLHARRDLRVLARDGWVLVLGLVSFGTIAVGLFYNTFPRGLRGILFAGTLIVLVLLAGGLVGPMITRALTRRSG